MYSTARWPEATRGRVSYRLGLLTRNEGRGLCEHRFLTLINTNDGNDGNVTLKNNFALFITWLKRGRILTLSLKTIVTQEQPVNSSGWRRCCGGSATQPRSVKEASSTLRIFRFVRAKKQPLPPVPAARELPPTAQPGFSTEQHENYRTNPNRGGQKWHICRDFQVFPVFERIRTNPNEPTWCLPKIKMRPAHRLHFQNA